MVSGDDNWIITGTGFDVRNGENLAVIVFSKVFLYFFIGAYYYDWEYNMIDELNNM